MNMRSAISMHPWHRLITLSGQQGVKADWCGFYPELLKPVNLPPAEHYPCPKMRGCYMRVAPHMNGGYVGICDHGIDDCDKKQLQKNDLIIHRLDHTALFAALGKAFGLDATTATIFEGDFSCWHIGSYNPAANYRFPVMVLLENDPATIEQAISQISTQFQQPFFIVLPVAIPHTHSMQEAAQRNRVKIFSFDDLVDSSLKSREGIGAIIKEATNAWMPDQHHDCYPTPAGAEWKDFLFEFTADEMVTISCKKSGHKQLCPEDLGMRDKRDKTLTKAWVFLQALAQCNGQMPIRNLDERIKKTKQAVSKALCGYFQMDADPITWSDKIGGYQTNFLIRKSGRFQSDAEF